MERIKLTDSQDAGIIRGGDRIIDHIGLRGMYHVEGLKPRADAIPEFERLWNIMCAAILDGDEDRAAGLRKQMRPLQYRAWQDVIHNVITTVGGNDLLDKYLKGSAYTQTIRMGLKGTGTAVVGDTQASHAGWLEQGLANAPTYTGNRPSITMGSASAKSSVSPAQAFAITSTGTVFGCFINNGGSATKDDTTGILFSAGDFSGGSKAVVNLDTLNVIYTLNA
jgi:hypothetical protein